MVFTCSSCNRCFNSLRGLNIHSAKCLTFIAKEVYNDDHNDDYLNNNFTLNQDQGEIETALIVNSQTLLIESVNDEQNDIQQNLPPYIQIDPVPPSQHNNLEGKEFAEAINKAYNEVIFWKKNLFMLPNGKPSKKFIRELSFWIDQYNRNTQLHGIAIKVFMLLPSLLLQKPSKESKAKEHFEKLKERLNLWYEGKIEKLLSEGRTIQRRILSSKRRSDTDVSKIFTKLMLQGKVNAAIKYLSENNDCGVLTANNEVVDKLREKHPTPGDIAENSLLNGPLPQTPASYFDNIKRIHHQKSC